MTMRKKRQIRLTLDDVGDFVEAAGQCDFDIDIFYNRVIVDAKSFLGVFSLDLNKTLTVRYAGENAKFEKILQKYCVA